MYTEHALQGTQRRQMLEERKRELQAQQKGNEEEHLQILRTMAEHDTVDFKQKVLQARHSFEKATLQEVSPHTLLPLEGGLFLNQV